MNIAEAMENAILDYAAERKLANEHLTWTCYSWEGALYLSLNPVSDELVDILTDDMWFSILEFFRDGPIYIKLASDFVLSEEIRSSHNIRLVEDKPLDPKDVVDFSEIGCQNNWQGAVYLFNYRFSNELLLSMSMPSCYLVLDNGLMFHDGLDRDDPIG